MIQFDLFLGHIIVRNVHSAGQETVFLYLVQYHFRLNSTQFIKSNTNLGDSMSRICEHKTFFGAIADLLHKTAISWIITWIKLNELQNEYPQNFWRTKLKIALSLRKEKDIWLQLTDLQTRGSTIIKVYFAMNSWQIMYQMLDEVYHLNIFWTRTHSLLTFGCSWMCASSQQASSPSREAAAALPSSCRAEWGSCKTPVASQGPGLKLPPGLFCFGEHLLKAFFLDTFETGNTLVHAL